MVTKLYAVYSSYDSDGTRSRHVKAVKGQIIEINGMDFGIYRDKAEGVWKLLDIKTGKLLNSNKSLNGCIAPMKTPPVWEKYCMIQKTDDYLGIMREYESLKREAEKIC